MAEDQEFTLPQQEERPLVTFALFAYNQEKYIREAVEGAFAQTYEPLEIILSDDCSTDRTFEIMEEMAAAYSGPHSIKVRRSPKNRGLGLHISDVAVLVSGELVVVGAGDDISLPERTAALVELMQREGAEFAESNCNIMTDNGEITDINLVNDYSGHYIWELINADPDYFASGATAIYRRSFLLGALSAARSAINTGKLYHEDLLFAAYAVAIDVKPANYTKSGLINYRINPKSLSNFYKKGTSFLSELELVNCERFRSATRLAALTAILEIASKHQRLASLLKNDKIAADKKLSDLELFASDQSFLRRLRALSAVRTAKELKIYLARLLGLKTLAWMRFFKKKLCPFNQQDSCHQH